MNDKIGSVSQGSQRIEKNYDDNSVRNSQDLELGSESVKECQDSGNALRIPRNFGIIDKLGNLIPHHNREGQHGISQKIPLLLTCSALFCAVLMICLYLRQSSVESPSPSRPQVSNAKIIEYRKAYIPITAAPVVVIVEEVEYHWHDIGRLLETHADKRHLHIKVDSKVSNPNIKYEIETGTLKILGKPNYCTVSESSTPLSVAAPHVTHLRLSDMDECHHYVKLVLGQWHFPNVQHIKLQKMLIREQEFDALSKFIDKHNETISRVEIDNCSMCPSPICDAGSINFPDHDFQISITRRRESPDWL